MPSGSHSFSSADPVCRMTSTHSAWCAIALRRTDRSGWVSEPSRYSSSWNRLELIAPIRTPRSSAWAVSLA